jgi:Fanconi anemia group M protein
MVVPPPPVFINNPFLKKNKVLKRQYQVSIFATCARSNCLVVVPTGLGKTMVALLLAIHRLTEQPGTKIIFLAPTRPLVDQHLRTFTDLSTFDTDQMVVLTGNIGPEKRTAIYQNAQILFMTPQVLQNDLIGNRLDLKSVSLLIFDEAHRGTGDYAYVFLAKKYQQQNPGGKILAMTASPGKNREKIEEVMTNLYLNAIEIRTEDDPDVLPYIQEVEMVWKDVELPPEMLEIHKVFADIFKKLSGDLVDQGIIEKKDAGAINRKDLLAATTILDAEIAKANTGRGGNSDLPRLLFLKKGLSNAIRISHMQELLEAQGLLALKAFIDKSLQEIETGTAGKSLREMFNAPVIQQIVEKVQRLATQHVDHPKMAVLMQILQEEFTASPQSRILLFCHFRDTVNTITELINQSPLIRAERFVGQQTKGKEKGLSQKDQLLAVQRFKAGEINVLVATSVAEEGLDIAECDVVIFYDVVPSEIRAIQRRGRTGRNRKGKVYLLKTKGTREESYFWAERMREREMKRVLVELKRELGAKYSPTAALQRAAQDPAQRSLTNFMNAPKPENLPLNEEANSNPPLSESIGEESEEEEAEESIPPYEDPENPPNIARSENSAENAAESPIDPGLFEPNPSIREKFEFYILVDSRESASPVTRELSEMNIGIELKTLPMGDYVLSDRVGIERKAVPDLVASIKDGRLFDELWRLKAQFPIPILIIEGDLRSAASLQRPALLGAITAVLLKLNIYLYQTHDAQETAEILYALAKKEQSEHPSRWTIRFKKLPPHLEQQLEYIVAGIPGINALRAQELLAAFHTLRNLFNSTPEELQRVPTIGPKLAENIYHFATAEYHGQKRTDEDDPDSSKVRQKKR